MPIPLISDPFKVAFTLLVTNFYVNQSNVPLRIELSSGSPSSYAVLVNNSNRAEANWRSYTSSNIMVALGPTNGFYTVSVGLGGSISDPQPVWQSVTFEKDASPLVLMITNLSSLAGARPFIDPAGYASRALRSISYAVTNADGATYSGQGQAVARGLNPGDPMHTTNLFTCVDLALTRGTNLISIQASDWTGTTAVTNFAYIFSTAGVMDAPSLTMLWPATGTRVTGDHFVVQALVDDDTAAVTLEFRDANAILETIDGQVERGGKVWVEDVPLLPGTNYFTLKASNAAGKTSTNKFTVIGGSGIVPINGVKP